MTLHPQGLARTHDESQGSLEVRLLGPLEVRRSGESLKLGGPRPRALLALLCTHLGTVVPSESIVDDLWGEAPPATARHMVAVYVSNLRKCLGEDALVTQSPGYRLLLSPEQLDTVRFERLLAEGREALAVGDSEAAAARLGEALALWRGPALADFIYEPFAQAEIARLEELRLVAEEERVEAELVLGRSVEVVAELETLVAAAPLRERRQAQLMRALYGSGRQAEALAAYQQARLAFVDELGIEPGPELRELERAILTQEEWLLLDRPSARKRPYDREARKPVSILFAEVLGSGTLTALSDPEALQRLLDRYFEAASSVIARHGGTVDRFIDGVLVAAFGAPVAHEDDALRAVRAASELKEALGPLDDVVTRERGLRPCVRIGVNSGEVVTREFGKGQAIITGEVVNAAGQLQQLAAADEVVLGEATRQLVADTVWVEPLDEDSGGQADPPPIAWRLVSLRPEETPILRRFDGRLVAREREIERIHAAFAQTALRRSARLFTIVGEPGIGKTRLALEVIAGLQTDAQILTARCPSYGEGAFWPLGELVRQATGAESRQAISTLLEGEEGADVVADHLAAALGLTDDPFVAEEISWATRRLLETLGRTRPLVVVFDDVHWAAPILLDLIEYVVRTSSGVPLLVLCLARTDLLEEHPNWGTGPNTEIAHLDTLSDAESRALVNGLPTAALLHERRISELAATAGGNPLFLEQLVAFASEQPPVQRVALPPTIEALLAARLDRLGPAERAVLECAAVIGSSFSTDALSRLVPAAAQSKLSRHLEALVRKELLAPDLPQGAFQEWFRFRHILIQRAAYRSIAKVRRADLHERFADWAEGAASGRDELVGFHLEQAVRCRTEVGLAAGRTRDLALRAGVLLGTAGKRVWRTGQEPAGADLLTRSVDLLPAESEERADLLVELGTALKFGGDRSRARVVLCEAIETARSTRNARAEWLARIELAEVNIHIDPPGAFARARSIAEAAVDAFDNTADDAGLARAWLLLASVYQDFGSDESTEAARRALTFARRAGDEQAESASLGELAKALESRRDVEEAMQELAPYLAWARERGNASLEVFLLARQALLSARAGRFDEARATANRRRAIAEEFGLDGVLPHITWQEGIVEYLARDFDSAERKLRAAYDELRGRGESAYASTLAAELGQVLYRQERLDEAEELSRVSEDLADVEDVVSQIQWRGVRAKVLARAGRVDEAEALAREAIQLACGHDIFDLLGDAHLELAEVLSIAHRLSDAKEAARTALELYERRSSHACAESALRFLAGIGGASLRGGTDTS